MHRRGRSTMPLMKERLTDNDPRRRSRPAGFGVEEIMYHLKKLVRAALLLPVASVMWSLWAVAQQTSDPVTTTTTTTTTEVWYGQWWIWAVGVGVFLIVIIALTNRGGRSSA
jgi:hypothetical protein